jgi:2-succinyl-5-enolpyruvyl-6-hydroxy-3-cyclohexene-1-carboxylate synthase
MKKYTREKNAQLVLALLKAHNIRKVVVSPGATNVSIVASMQCDPFFEIYSSVDERSAAYMACGLAAESNEPVVISCTGATASRNYLPGITEAYYRKLPVLAITSTQATCRIGHHIAQVIDRSTQPNDTYKISVTLPIVKDDEDLWDCEIKINQAILALSLHGGGPAHINLPTQYDTNFSIEDLPQARVIQRHTDPSEGPEIRQAKVAVFVGSRKTWNDREIDAVDHFCQRNNAIVLCDHTSGYKGKYRIQSSIVGGQRELNKTPWQPELLIHIGEISGDYYSLNTPTEEVWRVSEDGELRDPFKKLTHVFQMSVIDFFESYAERGSTNQNEYFEDSQKEIDRLRAKIPDLPFSNVWLASQLAHRIPSGSALHFGILNSLRTWNFFYIPYSVATYCNVGGFGIDGGVSSLIGASLADSKKLYFAVIGDLAFFYDMNVLGNRHVGRNLRILLVNNGKGTEFKQYGHHAAHFGNQADDFIAASGHFGNQSPTLVKHYAESLGFEYFSARDEGEVLKYADQFLNPRITQQPMLFEVFTDSDNESKALEIMLNLNTTMTTQKMVKGMAKKLLGEKGTEIAKKWMK